jgi:hypothetical protein
VIELTGERPAGPGAVAAGGNRDSGDDGSQNKSSALPQLPRDDGAFQHAATRVGGCVPGGEGALVSGQVSAMIFQEVLLRNISQRASWPRMQITAPRS